MRCEISNNDSNGVTVAWSGTIELDSSLISNNGETGLWIFTMYDYFLIHSNTFVGNKQGMFWDANYPKDNSLSLTVQFPDTAYMYGNIFAFNDSIGVEAYLTPPSQLAVCNNSFGNPFGDWIDPDFGAGDGYGNISLNPLFCNYSINDFRLMENSPCAPQNNGCSALMGAFPVGCECCLPPIRGNIDYDPGDLMDIADLVYFVDFSFGDPPGPPPPCFLEADVDGSNDLNIAYIVYMVEYMFSTPAGPAPVECP